MPGDRNYSHHLDDNHRSSHRSRPGPKSRDHCVKFASLRLWSYMLTWTLAIQHTTAAVIDARVGSLDHQELPEAIHQPTTFHDWAKQFGENRHTHGFSRSNPQPIRKRAFQRAIQRAQHSVNHTTWYRGRLVHLRQLRPSMKPVPQGADQTGRLPTPAALSRTGRRLRLVTWNTGGLSSTVYRKVLTWLQEEHQADRTVDICILQETAWREDMEFTTTPVGPGSLTWHAVHSAGGDRTGILCLVRAGLLNPTHIRTATLVPGRLVHLRLLFEVPLDILCIYQFAWNLQKVELRGAKNKTDAMLRQRRQIWQHVDKWIRAIPQRNGCVVLGDLNVSVLEEQHMCGAGLPPSTSAAHPDQGALLEILRAHRCAALNAWSRPGPANRTFLSPHAGEQHGTQIDFIVTRGHLVDHIAKQAAPFDAAFVPVNIHHKRQQRPQLQLCGGCQLSLDISCAYDHVRRPDLEAALHDAKVPSHLIQAILLIHEQARLKLSHCGQERQVVLRRGLRQGCGLAPILWALYSGWCLSRMHDLAVLDITRSNTTYADDMHYAWLIKSGRDLEAAYAGIKHVLSHLIQRGLSISLEKTVIIMELAGPQAARAMAKYTVQLQQGRHMKFVVNGKPMHLKLVTKHVYLGAVINYHRFEHVTYTHRLPVAKGSYARLGSILRNRTIPVDLRLQLWKGCIWPALLHGLDCTGLPLVDSQALQIQLIKQARAITCSHSMLTRETNVDFVARLRLSNPVERLRGALRQRTQLDAMLGPGLHPSLAQQQWRAVVSGHLYDTQTSIWHREHTASINSALVCVERVIHETFGCEVCGYEFTTHAALKRHQFRLHMDEQQQTARIQTVKSARMQTAMEHAKDGMPQCRHCLHEFTTWHAFQYHVSSRSCPTLRDLARLGEQEPAAVATLSEALVDSRDLLELAKDCSWQDIASHVLIKQKLNHCPECNHWSVRPQYVRRHMLAKHPERAELMQKCITNIQKSNISIQNPCQYCGQQYQRRDAHLRSCIGIFNGVFLHHRLARGKPLSLAGDSVVAEGQIGTHVLRGHVRSHGKGSGGAAGSDAGPTDASIPDAHHDARRTGGAESAGGPLRQPPAEVAKVRAKGAGKRRPHPNTPAMLGAATTGRSAGLRTTGPSIRHREPSVILDNSPRTGTMRIRW